MFHITRWSKMVHGQPNSNDEKAYRNDWWDVEKAMSVDGKHEPKGSAYSYFEKSYHGNKKKEFKDRPTTLAASEFGLTKADIPSNAYITKITFKVKMKVSERIKVRVPRGRFIIRSNKHFDELLEDGTGWDKTYYNHSPSGRITNTWKEVNYVMNEKDLLKGGYDIQALFDTRFGIDLLWYEQDESKSTNRIRIKSVGVTIDYVVPNHLIKFDEQTNGNNPRYTDVGEEYSVKITHTNDSKAIDIDRGIKVNIPSSIEVVGVKGNYKNGVWTVSGKSKSKDELILRLKNWDVGIQKISLSEKSIGSYDYYVYGSAVLNDIGEVKCYTHNIHKGHKEYVEFKTRVNSPDDEEISFNVNVDTKHTDINVTWTITEINDVSIIGDPVKEVSINKEKTTNTLIVFNVPKSITKDITFRGYFANQNEGETTAKIGDYTSKYTVLPPYTYIFSNNESTTENECNFVSNPSRTQTKTYRAMLETTLQTPIIECPFVHNLMEVGDSKLTAEIFDKRDYIGKVV